MKSKERIVDEFNLHLQAHQHQLKRRNESKPKGWSQFEEDSYNQTVHELNMLRWVLDYHGEELIK